MRRTAEEGEIPPCAPVDHAGDLVALEGDPVREEFVERGTQAVDVAGGAQLVEAPRACSGLM